MQKKKDPFIYYFESIFYIKNISLNVSSAKSMQCNRLLGQQQRLFLTFFFLGLINNVLYMHKIVFILLSNISNID